MDEILKVYEKKFPMIGFSLRLKLPRIIKNNHQNIHDTFSDLLFLLEGKIESFKPFN